jgi:hypothetical protein
VADVKSRFLAFVETSTGDTFVGKMVNRLQRPESAWDLETALEGLEDVAERLGSGLRPFQGVIG